MAVIEVEFFNKKDLGLENDLVEEDKLLADLKQKVETFDYSNVEDGTYRIGFRRPGVQSTSFFVTIKVKDHHHSFLK